MRHVVVDRYGGPEVLSVRSTEPPQPGPGEVLVAPTAVGVSLAVVRLGRGDGAGGGVPLPYTPGGEVAGRVVAVGPDVAGVRVGDRVAGLSFSGAYAELAVVPEAFAAAVPDDVDDPAAVALVRGGHVALGVLEASGLRAGESVLVTAAASGVGHLAVQLARAAGAGRVVAAVSAAAGKREFLTGVGADQVVDYEQPAEEWGGPFDVVLDGTGGPVQTTALELLAPMGRLVSYNANGVPVDVNLLRLHARAVVGFAMAPFVRYRPDDHRRHRDQLWQAHRDGTLRPRIHATYPLERAADAHRVVEDRANLGRVLLTPGPGTP